MKAPYSSRQHKLGEKNTYPDPTGTGTWVEQPDNSTSLLCGTFFPSIIN